MIYTAIDVDDSEITVWVIAHGHAYPMPTAYGAHALWRDDYVLARRSNPYLHDDAGFRAAVANPDTWWDQRPDARFAPAVAPLLAGGAS